MKIGILTFHMAHNFGAMLQAYALSFMIQKMTGCSCQIIDYRLPDIYQKYEDLLAMDNVETKRLKFEKFMQNELPLSQRVRNLQEAEVYDLYVLGSDQIWNPNITGGFKEEYFGKLFPSDAKCISYGASTGIDIHDWDYLAQKLEKVSKIGVRETWSIKNLSKYINREIVYCLDPVFLVESIVWKNLCCKINYENYILIYSFDVLESEYQEIEKRARENGFKIVEIVTHTRAQRDNIIYDSGCGPQEFISYINDADFIYTDSYHGVLFSIIFEKRFVYYSRGEKNDARVLDILKQLELQQTSNGYFLFCQKNKDKLQKYKEESLFFLKKSILGE